MLSFDFEGELFHRLNSSREPKKYKIIFGNTQYSYSRVQLIFLSLNTLLHEDESLEIEFPDDPDFNIGDFFRCYNMLDELFYKTTELTIDDKNVPYFRFIAESLDNGRLFQTCARVNAKRSQVFRFTSLQLILFPQKERFRIYDFLLIVNGKEFEINYTLFGIVSDKFYSLDNPENQLLCDFPDDVFQCFCSFFDIFQGVSFNFEDYDLPALGYLIDFFGLSCLSHFMNTNIPIPKNLDETLDFLKKPACDMLEKQFNGAMSIIFHEIETHPHIEFNQLDAEHFGKLLSSTHLLVENEDAIFKFVVGVVQRNPTMKSLLHFVYYPAVSSNLLEDYFEQIPVDSIEPELFNSLKLRIFSDVGKPNCELPVNRWKVKPRFISRDDIEGIYDTMFQYFGEEGNPLEQTQILIEEVGKTRNENEELKKVDQEKSEQINFLNSEEELKNQKIQELNDKIENLEKNSE